MDNLALQAMVCELRCAIVGQTVQKVKFCDEAPATLCLNLRSDGDLVVCLFPSLPLCFLSHIDLGLESRTSEQSTQLRKLLTGTRIISIKKEFGDRVVFFELENRRFLPTRQRVTLVLELMSNRSNILVLEQTQQVLFRLHRPKTPSVSGPDLYTPPVSKSGIQYDGVSREEFERLLLLHHGAGLPGRTSALASALGLSQTTLGEILIPGPEPGMSRW